MTELILGKRYRVVFNGTAETSNVDPNRKTLKIDGVGYLVHADSLDHAESVELLPDPLPTTPGSVIQLRDSIFARTDSSDGYHWKRVRPYTEGDFWGDGDLEGFATVLFDAGAPRA